MRRLRNTNIELGENVQRKHLNRYMLKLKNSGYSVRYRKQILDSATKGFDQMVQDDKMEQSLCFETENGTKKND